MISTIIQGENLSMVGAAYLTHTRVEGGKVSDGPDHVSILAVGGLCGLIGYPLDLSPHESLEVEFLALCGR
jgi:hypothetical protein